MIVKASVKRPEISHNLHVLRENGRTWRVETCMCVCWGERHIYQQVILECIHELHTDIYIFFNTGAFMVTGLMSVLWVVKTAHLCGLLSVARVVTMFGVLPHFFLTQSYELKAHWELAVRSCQTVA